MVAHGYKPSAVEPGPVRTGQRLPVGQGEAALAPGLQVAHAGCGTLRGGHPAGGDQPSSRSRPCRVRCAGVPDRRFGAFVALLIDTGARKSELLERRWKDFDLDAGEIVCETTKTGVPRVLHFRDETAALIRRVCPRRSPRRCRSRDGCRDSRSRFRKAWLTAVAEIGLPDLHMHDIRHAAAAGLLRAGVTLGVAAQVLGHSPQVLAGATGTLKPPRCARRRSKPGRHQGTELRVARHAARASDQRCVPGNSNRERRPARLGSLRSLQTLPEGVRRCDEGARLPCVVLRVCHYS